MLFEMTLSYDIILPLMLCSVIAYYTAKGFQDRSLYSEVLKRKTAEEPASNTFALTRVSDLTKPNPPVVTASARFTDIAGMFLKERVNNFYVVDEAGKFLGVVALHDIKPYLGEPDLAELVIARDIMRDDFPHVAPDQPLTAALGRFLGLTAERLPVVDANGVLIGSLAKTDLLLALVEKQKKPVAA
jgi:CIC family chloride channel protein